MIEDEAMDKLIKGILETAYKTIDNANFNKGFTGRVFEIIDDRTYIVIVNNKQYIAKSRFKLEIGEVVKIVSWNNDMSELYVIY